MKRQELEEARGESATLVEILESRQAGLVATLDGSFPELRTTIWQSKPSVQAAVQTLTPQMTENKKKASTPPGAAHQPADLLLLCFQDTCPATYIT